MRKFKLIKEYPGSDHEGIIVSLKTPNGLYEGYQYNYSTKHVENNPEYWEEVVEKDYEILESCPIEGTIYSVKRLSDGEVFTVGDSVKVYEYSYIKNITGIIININPLVKEGIWLRYDSGSSHLSHAIKSKQPIFLTHDGKDIFVGDRIIWVNKDSLLHGVFTADYGSLFLSDQVAYFTSAVDAEDYINKNKVLFTTEDGVGIKQGNTIHGVFRTSNTISNTVVRNDNRICEVFEAIFSTRAAAENYLVQKSHSLSIEDFWEFVSWGGSTIAKSKRLKRLVKERLNLK